MPLFQQSFHLWNYLPIAFVQNPHRIYWLLVNLLKLPEKIPIISMDFVQQHTFAKIPIKLSFWTSWKNLSRRIYKIWSKENKSQVLNGYTSLINIYTHTHQLCHCFYCTHFSLAPSIRPTMYVHFFNVIACMMNGQ